MSYQMKKIAYSDDIKISRYLNIVNSLSNPQNHKIYTKIEKEKRKKGMCVAIGVSQFDSRIGF